MEKQAATPVRRVSLDQNIEWIQTERSHFTPFPGKGKSKPTRRLEEFKWEVEGLIGEMLGETSGY